MPAPSTRHTLIARIRNPDDDRAWAEFVEIYTPVVYNFAAGRGLRKADAEDLTQDVMQGISRSIGNFEYREGQAKFRSWLYQITRNRMSTFFQQLQRRDGGRVDQTVTAAAESINGHEDGDEARWEKDYRRQLFRWAAAIVEPEFNPRIWQAFWRSAVEEEELANLEKELEMSRAAIYMAKSRCIKRLREKIEATGEEWEMAVL